MTKEEIKSLLGEWSERGLLCSKRSTGLDYSAIKRAIGRGELFATSFENVIARTAEVRDEFEGLIREDRVMNTASVMARTPLTTSYKINIACADGEMLRFSKLGNAAVLYIK